MKKFTKFSVVAAVMLVMIFAMSASVFSAYAYFIEGEGVCDVELNVDETASISFIPETSGWYTIASDYGYSDIDPVCNVILDGEVVANGDDSYNSRDFDILYYFEAGNVYVLEVYDYNYNDAGSITVSATWIDLHDGFHYISGKNSWICVRDGAFVKNEWVQNEHGQWFYMGDDGYSVRNNWIANEDGNLVYLGDDGSMLTDSTVGFFDEIEYEYGVYYVGSDGCIVKGRTGWYETLDGSWIYFQSESGRLVTHTWMKDSKGWCYLTENGYMMTNNIAEDSVGLCYVGSNGYQVTTPGWRETSYGDWVYIQANGYLATDTWMKDSKGWCYLSEWGYMLINGTAKDSVGTCYIGNDGYQVTGRTGWFETPYGDWIYFKAGGYLATDTWMKDSGGWCYLDEFGYMVWNGTAKDSKGVCYIGSNGYQVTGPAGWYETYSGRWIYIKSDGYILANQWFKYSGEWYYFNEYGYMAEDEVVNDGTGLVYLDFEGHMVANEWIGVFYNWDGGEDYYYDEAYVGADGYLVKSKWIQDADGYWYYIRADYRKAADEWIKDSKGWCYVDYWGQMVTNDFAPDSKGWCYLDANGYIVKSQWVHIVIEGYVDAWVYVNANGYVIFNDWAKIDGVWYYFGETAEMYADGIYEINGEYHEFDANGAWLGKIS